MFEKMVEIGDLFDFYGNLLSDKQRTVTELYYVQDFSLSEIGENLGISRQGAHDTLKRAEANLYGYEERLGLVEKFELNKTRLKKIVELIDSIEAKTESLDIEGIKSDIGSVKEIYSDILD
ncbi:putative DNA-binding protein [Andreesenia angusta]|uniref:UPF0122 protein EUAN_05150 n=1 Tax=Andreesenia angusta TaxID=39480 RepID=A0A1S1V803_9FIRM|nr:YlxM family DNA-binding protein [Andreesenia angusta]OHW62731.1 putative DNA-binding protein [Andreesenia angusta]